MRSGGPLLDRVDRRVLAAVRLVDVVTGRPIARPLSVSAEGVRFLRGRSGLYVISAAGGLEAHTTAFEAPPAEPPPESLSFELRMEDPLEVYLERRATIRLPRRAGPPADDPQALPDLFRPIDIEMFPSPAAPVRPNWGGLRLTVRRGNAPEPRPGLPGVLATLHRPGTPEQVLARGLSDERGEAVVLVPGLKISQGIENPPDDGGAGGGGGPVTTPVTQAELDLLVRRDLAWPVDPATLGALPDEAVVAVPSVVGVLLRTGEIRHLELEVPVPD